LHPKTIFHIKAAFCRLQYHKGLTVQELMQMK
jgi:hypothetical protein